MNPIKFGLRLSTFPLDNTRGLVTRDQILIADLMSSLSDRIEHLKTTHYIVDCF